MQNIPGAPRNMSATSPPMLAHAKADGSAAPSSCAWLLCTYLALRRRRKSFAVWPCRHARAALAH